jgi:N-methylhydantoinase B
VRLGVTLMVCKDGLTFDFSRCGPQIASGKNVPYTHLMATVYFCTKAIIDPAMPVNEGLYRAVRVIAPEGSVVNPRPPGGVGSRNLTSMILADAILQCFGQAAPSLAMAAGGPYQGIILAGPDPVRNRFYVDYENFAGGQGGTAKGDGLDVMQLHMTNTSNLPVEVMELEFPVRVERYELIPDSGGAGKHRGGLGVRRDLRITAPEAVLALRSARQVFPALGLQGGREGTLGAFLLDPDAATPGPRLPSTASEYGLQDGALLRIVTPGGGGYGDPRERDPEAVARDVRQGKVSVAAARDIYGVVTDAAGTLDAAATAALRASFPPQPGSSA